MSDKIMVSVMCTAFNHGEYIRQALEGMVNQKTDFAYEILINDDVSSDNTPEIIREFEAKYPEKVRAFFPEKNLYSQNIDVYYHTFFPNARGKYVAFCEGDDYWTDESKLQRQVDILEAHPEYSACVHNTELLYCDGNRDCEKLIKREGDRIVEFEDILPGMSNAWHTSSVMAKKELLANPTDYYNVACEYGFGDYPWGIMLRNGGPVWFIDRCMSVYRINSNNASWSSGVDYATDKLVEFLTGIAEMLKTFRPHVRDEKILTLVDKYILDAQFQLLYTQGRDRELRKPPYDAILKTKPLSFRVKNLVKCAFPGLQKLYRRLKGYNA